METKIIIKKGSELFHSSIEPITLPLRVGGYDKILWTAEDSGISQYYIPVSGMKTTISTKAFSKPSQNEYIQNFQKKIGLEFKDVIWLNNYTPKSYISPPLLSELTKDYKEIYNNFWKQKEKIKNIEKTLNYDDDESLKNFKKELVILNNLEKSYKQLPSEDKYINDYINSELSKLGYEPKSCDKWDSNCRYLLKLKNDEILPANFREKGKLFILKPKRDLNIFNYAQDNDGDLTDLDYHKVDLFRKVEKEGYDGIKINDFAQSEYHGNLGHHSIGLFANTIKDLDVEIIKDVEHPDEKESKRMSDTRNWKSKEYIKYKN